MCVCTRSMRAVCVFVHAVWCLCLMMHGVVDSNPYKLSCHGS